ncbi:TIGR02221 family CRISPR-associated protein [Thermodesulfobacteriota bacterium B35]
MSNRKVFITFLGTGKYTTCNYTLEGKGKVDEVEFIQEAMARMVCKDFGPDDRFCVFLTNAAREKHWPKLEKRLADCGLRAKIKPVSIPDGGSEEELWHIFSTVVDQFEQGDRVIFDITHGFRSLPMLGMVLLPYARLLKGIEVDGIYYGAFEVLGPAFKVKEMPMAERNAPVFDLTSFADLLDWTAAVQEFVRHGNPAGIADLLKGEAGPRLGASRGNDPEARTWRDLGNCLAEIAGQITTSRGAEIVKGNYFGHLGERVAECSGIEVPPPFRPLLDRIAEKAAPFGRDQAANCLAAVRWCLEHGLVQQGLTMLQEGVITILVERFGLDWGREEDRELVSGAVFVLNKGTPRKEWKQVLQKRPELVERIHADTLVRNLAPVLDRLGQARNDINHGGFLQEAGREALKAPVLIERLECCFMEVEKILGNVARAGH